MFGEVLFFNSISIFNIHTNASGSVVPLEMFAKMYAVSDGSGYYELCHDADNAIMKTESVTVTL